MTWATFKIAELRLDQQNYRTGPQSTQRDAIRAIIQDQQIKLVNHARHILEHGLNQGEPPWVVRDDDGSGMYVVVEGNRRVAALKLMENPELADGTIVEKQFRDLAVEFKKKPIRELEACVYPSREAARPWVAIRHSSPASGVGLQPWNTSAKGRANEAEGGVPLRHLIVRDFLEDDSEEWANVATALDSKWSTVDRVLNSEPMHKALGVGINRKSRTITFESGDEDQGRKLLMAILIEMAGDHFDFADIEKKGHRETFLGRFNMLSVKAPAGAAAPSPIIVTPLSGKSTSVTPAPKAVRAKPHHSARPTLAPKSGALLQVTGRRLNPLYNECRNIVVAEQGNAAALLLRVFLELSSELLLIKRKVLLPKAVTDRRKKSWSDVGVKLSWKITACCDYLDPSGNAQAFQQARLGADETARSNYAVWTLHGYFHNPDLIPQASDLIGAWDAWEAYLRAVTDDLQKP